MNTATRTGLYCLGMPGVRRENRVGFRNRIPAMSTRILLIVLDSAEPSLVRAWAAAGVLPTIDRLLTDGDSLDIVNLPGFGNSVFWPTLNTGVDPSWHGCYYLAQPKPPDYRLEPFLREDFSCAPFWRELEDDGFRVAVIDAVESPVAQLKHGIEVSDWITHRRELPPRSWPSSVIDELIGRYGDDPLRGNANLAVREGMTMETLSEMSTRRIAMKTDAAVDLLGRRDWDLFSVAYPDPHDMGHLAWHLRNEDRPHADNPLKRCYRDIDAAVARLKKHAGTEARTMLILGPGMEEYVSANHVLSDILRAYEGRRRHPAVHRFAKTVRRAMLSPAMPHALRLRLRRARQRTGRAVEGRSGRRFFAVPHNANAGAIRLNVAGREPAGTVAPGEPYDTVCDELCGRLLALRDATGKQPVVAEVIRLCDRYNGPQLARLPDLLVVWNRDADLSRITSPEIGAVAWPSYTVRTGDHSKHGLLISDRPLRNERSAPVAPSAITPILREAVKSPG